MQPRVLLLFGLAIPVVFFAAIVILAAQVDGYSHVSQTVSEIGESGSPAELPWKIAALMVALFYLLFSWGIYQFARANSLSAWPAYLVGMFGLASIGIAIFESPHPLHNSIWPCNDAGLHGAAGSCLVLAEGGLGRATGQVFLDSGGADFGIDCAQSHTCFRT